MNSIDSNYYPRSWASGNSTQKSICRRIRDAYMRAIRRLVEFLDGYGWDFLAATLGSWLTEPLETLKATVRCPFGCKKNFNYYSLNPSAITREQSEKQPILLVHGNYHNASAWFSLSKALKASGLGPVYTINLPSGDVTDKDYEFVQKKVDEIRNQYLKWEKTPLIHLVGHSRGGGVATGAAWPKEENGRRAKNPAFGKVITMGFTHSEAAIIQLRSVDSTSRDHHYEMVGEDDILHTDASHLDAAHQKVIPAGHLGLLTHSKAHQQIIQWLSN